MRERTRTELSSLIAAHLAAKDEAAREATLQALYDRAPIGNYYVVLDDGRRAILDIDDDGGCGVEVEKKSKSH